MNTFYLVAQLLLSQWIWSVTLGFSHPLINCIIMIPLLMYLARKKFLTSLMYALSSQGFAIMVFGIIAHFMLDYLGGVSFDQQGSFMTLHPLAASLILGITYALMQLLFFYGARFMWHVPFKTVAVIVALSNLMAALIVFRYVPVL